MDVGAAGKAVAAALVAALVLAAGPARAQGTAEELPAGPGVIAPEAAEATSEPREPLAMQLEAMREDWGLPALAAAIIQDGTIVQAATAGRRAVGSEALVTLDDPWHLGSCGKAMTATVIARLVERGTLSWTTPLASVFPDWTVHTDFEAVTIEQLLAHRAGLPEYPDSAMMQRTAVPAGALTAIRADVARQAIQAPAQQRGGSRFFYSNLGYVVAAAVAERLTGKAWETLMEEELFEPLGLASAGFGAPGIPADAAAPGGPPLPFGHRRAFPAILGFSPVPPGNAADNPAFMAPAGTIHMSLRDWAAFIIDQMEGDLGRGTLLADRASYLTLHAPRGMGEGRFAYALGWSVRRSVADGQRLTLWHAGSNQHWFAVATMDLEWRFAVLVATNAGGQDARDAVAIATDTLIQDYAPGLAQPVPAQ